MKKFKIVLDEFLSEHLIEDKFREWAKRKEEILIFDFHRVKTIDRLSFLALLKSKKGLEMMGKRVYFCCILPSIAAIISMWDYEIEVLFDDIL